jgi:hypothetical protein
MTSATARLLTYPKLAVRPTHPTSTWTTRTFGAPTFYRQPPTRFSAPCIYPFWDSLTPRRGAWVGSFTFHHVRLIIVLVFCFHEFSGCSLLTDMSRILLQPNGAGQMPALPPPPAQPSSSGLNGVVSRDSDSTNDVRRLQDDVNQLTKRNGGIGRRFFSINVDANATKNQSSGTDTHFLSFCSTLLPAPSTPHSQS